MLESVRAAPVFQHQCRSNHSSLIRRAKMADAITKPTHGLFQDLTGQKFGRLKVDSFVEVRGAKSRHYYWHCVCECGATAVVDGGHLRSGHTQSCGCRLMEIMFARATHGQTSKLRDKPLPEYAVWKGIICRCCYSYLDVYQRYGGRGIKVCSRWRHSFDAFLSDMGPRPSSKHSIDRINNNGNYEPSNCRWASASEQSRNKRNSLIVEWDGVRISLPSLCEKLNMP